MGLALPLSAWAAEGDAVGRLYENYVASAAAAKRCEGVEPARDVAFLANMRVITAQAVRRTRDDTHVSDDEARAALDRHAKALEATVSSYIDDRGCADEKVAHLLQMYRFHSSARPFER
jgi:hypothetical protein